MSRSLAIAAVVAVGVGALAAAITLPALVLGEDEAPPAGLPLAGSGTRTVVQAAPLPAPPTPRARPAVSVPTFLPSFVGPTAVPIASSAHQRAAATPRVHLTEPKQRRAPPGAARIKPKPTKPAAAQQTLSPLSEPNKHAKPKKAKHGRPESASQKEHGNEGPKTDHRHEAPPAKPEHGQKTKNHEQKQQGHDEKPKGHQQKQKGHEQKQKRHDQKPKNHDQAPKSTDNGHGSDGGKPKIEDGKSSGDNSPGEKGPKR